MIASMNVPQFLAVFALGCLVVAAIIGRGQLRANPVLRNAIAGLLVAVLAGLGTELSRSALVVWPFATIMAGSLGFVVRTTRLANKNPGGPSPV